MRLRIFAVLLIGLLAPDIAWSSGGIDYGERVRISRVVDGDTVVLTAPVGGATQVRLVGIQAPKLPLGRPGFPTWPLAGKAKQSLEEIVLGKEWLLAYGGVRRDRHGRVLAHLFSDDGLWAQGEMLRRGMARVYSFADNRAMVARMHDVEKDARRAHRGIWGVSFYATRKAVEAAGHIGSFQLVEGKVLDTARVKGRVYLNFGDDWRRDFTITLRPKVRRLFEKEGIDPLGFKGKVVRVRGWLKSFNGPMIEATHPEQIEILHEPARK